MKKNHRKFFVLVPVMLIFAMLLSACDFTVNGNAVHLDDQQVAASLPIILNAVGASQKQGTTTTAASTTVTTTTAPAMTAAPTTAPALTTAAATTPAATTASGYQSSFSNPRDKGITATQLKQLLQGADVPKDYPYNAIDLLDAQEAKIDSPDGKNTLTSTNEYTYLIWSGIYVSDPTLGGKIFGVSLDGKTGLWMLNLSNSATIPTGNGAIKVTGVTQDDMNFFKDLKGTLRKGGLKDIKATDPVKKSVVLDAVKGKTGADVFSALDMVVNKNAHAQMRSLQPMSIIPAGPDGTRLVWVMQDNLQGSSWAVKLLDADGMSLYVLADGTEHPITHQWRGLLLDTKLTPDDLK